MPETLQKLRPDRDLQCYFERPTAVAALSQTSPTGFTLSGSWRQQFDWAVIEWNRDNTFEHPLFRNLPDGDLSGLVLSYAETRQNCIPMDSTLFPTVDWPSLRIWAESAPDPYKVPLHAHATPIAGSYQCASTTFELQGTPTENDYVELAWSAEHYTYQMRANDILETAVEAIVQAILANPQSVMTASRNGRQITLTYTGPGQNAGASTTGANGNRIGVYTNVSGAQTEAWSPSWQMLTGGMSPSQWQVTLDFGSLQDEHGDTVPTTNIRKMRWTYSADLQAGDYQRGEFQVQVTNWTVTGTNLNYQVAGPGSRRIEDDARDMAYTGSWTLSSGPQNFSGGSIHWTAAPGASVSCSYRAARSHALYLGTRKAPNGAQISVVIDGGAVQTLSLVCEDDVVVRLPLGTLSGGVSHTVRVSHAGTAASPATYFYFDFLELAIPTQTLPAAEPEPRLTLATDWDTDHSIALAPERTAWMIHALGFVGRANHYAGALWFYELAAQGFSYASATVTFTGTPSPNAITTLYVGNAGSSDPPTAIQHLNLAGDTAASIAKAFELELNSGYTAVRAQASGAVLTVYARAIGQAGEAVTISADPASGPFAAQASAGHLMGGNEGHWRTDLAVTPRLNRAARDWNASFFAALRSYGITATAALSMELQHGDPSPAAGIAQRYPDGAEVALNTPALQTNFSPVSVAFWQQAYLDLATLMVQAGQTPYLQFGEVQWWYSPNASGMPYYDAYTTSTFQATYGRPMQVFTDSNAQPSQYPQEAQFLPSLIQAFTNTIMTFVRQTFPAAVFEVLYPPDVNNTPLNTAVNFAANWTPSTLACLKTENFTYTAARNLNQAKRAVALPLELGFPRNQASHLAGVGDYTTPWKKEVRLAKGAGLESVVLFALDQFCLIGYVVPLPPGYRSSRFQG